MVNCDNTRDAYGAQQFADLQHLAFALTLPDYRPLIKLFGPDRESETRRGRGRPRYHRTPIVKAFLAAYILGIRGRQGIVDKLNNDPALRAACGWPTGLQIPHRSTVSRVFTKLADNPWDVHYLLVSLVNRVHELRPDFGVDVATQLPIEVDVSPANENDSPFLRKLLAQCQSDFDWFDPDIVLADRGYDGRENVQVIHDLNAAALIPRIERPNRSKSAVHTMKGEPMCLGGKVMEFIGTDTQAGLHGFRPCKRQGATKQPKSGR